MKKWIFSILAGISGAVAGLWFSENFMFSKLFLGGIEVDLSDPTAVEWALANPSKSEWLTYLVLGQDIAIVQPGSHWMTAVPVAFALILFSITFVPASLVARRKATTKNPFQKAAPVRESARDRKMARLTVETGSDANLLAVEKQKASGAGHPLVSMNGRPVNLSGSADLEAEESREVAPETQQDAAPETQQDAEPETQQDAAPETQQDAAPETQQDAAPETQQDAAPETQQDAAPVIQQDVAPEIQQDVAPETHQDAKPETQQDAAPETQQDVAPETQQDAKPQTQQDAEPEETMEFVQEETAESPKMRAEIHVEEPVLEATEPPAGDPEILEDETWKTHYDYLDSVRMIFDKLAARGEHMAVDFATRYMVDPKRSDLEAIVAQILEEERQRNRFSDNDVVEAAHVAMMEFSEEAAAEFRRVIRILGEDVDLNNITQKIRQRFPKTDKRSGIDPFQMNESQIITELRRRGFEIIAPAGGPYSVKDCSGSRVTKPFNLLELQDFLKEQRTQ